MKFGMPTLVECKDIYECCAVAERCGIDFVEINMSFPQYLPDNIDVRKLKQTMKDRGLFFTIHADEQLNPFDFNKDVSECYFDVFRKTIRFAKSMNIPVINMHLLRGVYVTLPGEVILLSDVYFDEYRTRVEKFIEMCEQEIGSSDIKIAIENVDTNPFTESQIKVLPRFMSSRVFGLTLDTGHEDCLGYKDSFVFEKYNDKVVHMHLHDSNGKKPHLALGDGNLDIGAKVSAFDVNTCLIEVKTIAGLEKSVEYLRANNLL